MKLTTKRRGQALVTAILALTVLTVTVIALSATVRLELRASRRGIESVQRDAALRGAVEEGIARLDRGRADPGILLATLRRYHELQWEPFQPPSAGSAGPGDGASSLQVSIQLLDASARLNVTSRDFSSESQTLGKELELNQKALQAIVSWQDKRSRDDYGREARPYEPARRPVDTQEELLLLHNADPQQFFGGPDAAAVQRLKQPPLSELLAAFSGENNADAGGHPRPDVNTASADELLAAANRYGTIVTQNQAQSLVVQRDLHSAVAAAASSSHAPDTGSQAASPPFRSMTDVFQAASVDQKHWGPLVDAWTIDHRAFLSGRVNANTASRVVLQALGMSGEQAQQVVRAREKMRSGLQWSDVLALFGAGDAASMQQSDLGDIMGGSQSTGNATSTAQQQQQFGVEQALRALSVRSSVYFVRCLVRQEGTERVAAATALVYWPSSSAEPAQIVQWREPDRYPGWTAWFRPVREEAGPEQAGRKEEGMRSGR